MNDMGRNAHCVVCVHVISLRRKLFSVRILWFALLKVYYGEKICLCPNCGSVRVLASETARAPLRRGVEHVAEVYVGVSSSYRVAPQQGAGTSFISLSSSVPWFLIKNLTKNGPVGVLKRCCIISRPHQAMNNQFPMAARRAGMDVIEAAKTVDMPLRLDNANALPTYPQQTQTNQQEAA